MSAKYHPPMPLGASKAGVQSFAEEVAEKLAFSAGDSIEDLVTRVGGRLVVGTSGFGDQDSGSVIAREANDFDIFVSRHTSLRRDRFTIAHEIGHLVLHLPKIKKADPEAYMRATRYVDPDDTAQQRAEWEANWFAAAFLMPSAVFKTAFQAGGVEAAASACGVSLNAAEIRSKNLGLTS